MASAAADQGWRLGGGPDVWAAGSLPDAPLTFQRDYMRDISMIQPLRANFIIYFSVDSVVCTGACFRAKQAAGRRDVSLLTDQRRRPVFTLTINSACFGGGSRGCQVGSRLQKIWPATRRDIWCSAAKCFGYETLIAKVKYGGVPPDSVDKRLLLQEQSVSLLSYSFVQSTFFLG